MLAPTAIRTAYGEGMMEPVTRAKKVMGVLARPPALFCGAHVHALKARFPRARYLDGWDAVLFGGLLPLLPSWFVDRGLLFMVWPPVPHAISTARSANSNSKDKIM